MVASSSFLCGLSEPMAVTWMPLGRSLQRSTGSRAGVVVTTISAWAQALAALSCTLTGKPCWLRMRAA
ncbi:hypothetical protein D3C80_1866000 [compost metagenome]